MDSINYSWNNGAINKLNVTSGQTKKITIPVGTNSLTVRAYDKSGNIEVYTNQYTVEKKKEEEVVTPQPPPQPAPAPEPPKEEWYTPTQDVNAPSIYCGVNTNPVSVRVVDDNLLQSVQYSLNGTTNSITVSSSAKEVKFSVAVSPGTNTLIITAIDSSGNRKQITKEITI